jgi:hypothetical protein
VIIREKKSWYYSKFLCSFASVEIGIRTYQILLTTGEEDPSDLLSKLEEQITQVKQEASRRKEILDKMEKWMSACEEEGWLEDYNKV